MRFWCRNKGKKKWVECSAADFRYWQTNWYVETKVTEDSNSSGDSIASLMLDDVARKDHGPLT